MIAYFDLLLGEDITSGTESGLVNLRFTISDQLFRHRWNPYRGRIRRGEKEYETKF